MLDGTLRPEKGVLPIAVYARAKDFKVFILHKAHAREAAVTDKLKIFGVETLQEVIDFMNGIAEPEQTVVDTQENSLHG